MAKPKYPTPSPELIAGSVAVDIRPRGYADWEGSSAQLIAEGLIPNGFEWPQRDRPKCWTADGLDYYLSRRRPAGMKGPKRLWVEGDYWALRTTSTAQGRDGFAAARLYEAKAALEREIALQRSGGLFGTREWCTARNDKQFQAFLYRASGAAA
jgi:hypothetical protein